MLMTLSGHRNPRTLGIHVQPSTGAVNMLYAVVLRILSRAVVAGGSGGSP